MIVPTINRERIAAMEELIRQYIRLTPVIGARGEDFGLDSMNLTFKLELLQHSGSFKARGAFANLLTRHVPVVGVVAASGGNHGAAVAYAARKLGMPAKIFVPRVASLEKIERIRKYGAELVITGERYGDALAASEESAAKSGALAVHAYDQEETLLGQGSVGLELEDQAPNIDTLLVAVGGGGLIGGIAAWCRNRIKVVGVEPELAPTLTFALRAGAPVDSPADGIAADSLAPRRIGVLTFPLAQNFVNQVILVPDEAIAQAQEILWKGLRIVTEPGGAAAFAALVSCRYKPKDGERMGVVISGGNTSAVDFRRFATEKSNGLLASPQQ